MFYKRIQIFFCTYSLLLEIRFLHAQKGASINEDGGMPNLVKSRLFDPANKGFPNFAPERFGNLGSNYPPGSPFFPFGNQFNHFQPPEPSYGWGLQNRYPNQEDFQGPQGGINQNRGLFPNHRGVFRPQLNEVFDPTSHNIKTNLNNPRAVPDDEALLRVFRPHQNGGSNFQSGQTNPRETLQFPTSNGNPDGYFAPDANYPNTRSQFPNPPINYPIHNTQYPNNRIIHNQKQYPAQNNYQDPRNLNPQTGFNANTQPPYAQNKQGGPNGNQAMHSHNQIPMNQATVNDGFNFNEGKFNDAPQNIPKLPDQNQHTDSGEAESDRRVAILGKPVFVPPEIPEPSDVDEESLKKAVKKQCVQDCETTSEYNPICGTDDVTYINPGKFACARTCGVNVNVSRYGRCDDDPPNSYARRH